LGLIFFFFNFWDYKHFDINNFMKALKSINAYV